MKCCNIITDLITGVVSTEDPSPPLTSEYCVQWSVNDSNLFFPCVEGADVNGNTDTSGGSGSICQHFSIADFDGVVGNTFYYDNFNVDEKWYAQVIRLNTNPVLADLGYYAYDVFGNIVTLPIPATTSNCTPTCYTATFEGIDITTDGFSSFRGLQTSTRIVDIEGPGGSDPLVLFNDPDVEALYKTKLITHAGFEPDATVTVTINSPTSVTLTICTILTFRTLWTRNDSH